MALLAEAEIASLADVWRARAARNRPANWITAAIELEHAIRLAVASAELALTARSNALGLPDAGRPCARCPTGIVLTRHGKLCQTCVSVARQQARQAGWDRVQQTQIGAA